MIKRSEKGSITLFTLIAMMFFLTIAFTAYASAMSKLQAQNEDLERIKASYEQDLTPEGLASLYEELTTKKPYTVTFDANGGTVDLPSKEVKYGKEYGILPVPTREGYKFMGWNGKNLLNPNAEYAERFDGVTRRDLFTYDEETGIYTCNAYSNAHHIYGYDVMKYISIGKTYTFSAKIEKNSTSNSIAIGFDTITNGQRKIYYTHLPTEEGKRFSYTLTIPSGVTRCVVGLINAGYSSAKGLQYSELQLEENTESTEYEPYYITSDTKVTQKKDHTLTAIWEEGVPPTLELSKETYIEEDFSDWTLNNARVIDEDGKKVLLIGEDGNAGSATSNYYEVQAKLWVPYYEAYETIANNNSEKGGVYNELRYFNQNYEGATNRNGRTETGVAFECDLNKWIASTVDSRYQLDTKYVSGVRKRY